ncbi:MAG TPA: 6-phosphofructokinase, partial [Balneolaceae bacterium]|nr:6-phosphofructokinase [Balneolaceae bacterium]
MVIQGKYGEMVAFQDHDIVSVPLSEATKGQNLVDPNSFLVQAAKGVGISFGD